MQTEQIINRIEKIMFILENIPIGIIGHGGATMEELIEAEKQWANYDNDGDYHTVQKAWLMLDNLRSELHQ